MAVGDSEHAVSRIGRQSGSASSRSCEIRSALPASCARLRPCHRRAGTRRLVVGQHPLLVAVATTLSADLPF